MTRYVTRALELHDFTQIWDLQEIRRKLDFMVRNGMNALVFHEPGIEDKIVFPARFLGADSLDGSYYEIFQKIDHAIYNHALRENLNLNRRAYMTHLIREAKEAGIEVYFENKELWFADFILTYKPDLVKDGTLCPSDPFWWEEFLPWKYEELFIALPDLAGVVVSIGTGESRLAISNTFACGCERCRNLDPVEWYRNMILAMHGPHEKRGKQLVIRDFIYSRAEQERFAKAFIELPDDIVLSLKNTPHDFYPTFPHNPLIGGAGNHPQWIEYDVHGQFFGWGSAPSIMLDDIRSRLQYGLEHGVSGFLARSDWEGVQDHTCFDTPNMINLYAIAALAADTDRGDDEIYLKWLTEQEKLRPDITPQELRACTGRLAELMAETWPIVSRTVYVNGTVFSNDSCVHVSLEQPAFIGETHHSLKEWDPTRADALAMTEPNVKTLLAEKDEALRLAERTNGLVPAFRRWFTKEAYAGFAEHFEFLVAYVRSFRLTARAYCFARYAKQNGDDASINGTNALELLETTADELRALAKELSGRGFMKKYPYDELLDPERFEVYLRDIDRRLSGVVK